MKYSTLLFLLFIQLLVLGQPKNQPMAVVAVNRNNIVYKEIPNALSIAVSGYYDKDLVVKTNVGKIEKVVKSNYNLFLDSAIDEETVKINVFVRNKKRILIDIGQYEFKILPFPQPSLALNNVFEKDSVSYEEIIKSESIYLYHKDFAFNSIKYEIKSFTFMHSTKGKVNFAPFKGNKLTKEMKELLLLAENDDMIYFCNVKALGPAGLEVIKSNLVLRIYKN